MPEPKAIERVGTALAARSQAVIARSSASGEPLCLNCGQAAPGKYCAACGQETDIRMPTVRQLVHEFVDQFIALENTLGRTLRMLALQPGELTLEYLRGRRQRYVRPFKLYLTVSVIFFSLVGLLPDSLRGLDVHVDDKDAGQNAAAKTQSDAVMPQPGDENFGKALAARIEREKNQALKKAAPPAEGGMTEQAPTAANHDEDADAGDKAVDKDDSAGDSALQKHAEKLAQKLMQSKSPEAQREMRKQLADDAPYAMFFLMPYFALLLRWFYRKSGRLYGEHLLFSVHLHTFAFMLLTLGFIPLKPLHTALDWGLGIYLFLALRHFYGGGWKGTLWRMALLYLFYIAAIAATAVSGVMAIVLGT